MRFMNVKSFAELKGCSRQTIYNAAINNQIEIDRSQGFPVVFLNNKNLKWNPDNVGRPKKVKFN